MNMASNADKSLPAPPHTTALALVDSVASEQLVDLAGDSLEVAFDAILDDGILKEIPVVGSVLKLIRTGISIKDAIFVRKLRRFLVAIGQVDQKERAEFAAKMDAEPAYKAKVGDKLLVALDRLDDVEKARLLADAFAGYVKGRYSYKLFSSLTTAIDRLILAYVDDYQQIYCLSNRLVEGFEERCFELQSCDLLQPALTSGGYRAISSDPLRWTAAGNTFFSDVLPRDNERLRAGFLTSVLAMKIFRPVAEEGYEVRDLTFDQTAEFVLALPVDDLLRLRIHGNQFNEGENAWSIRRIAHDSYQHFWDKKHR